MRNLVANLGIKGLKLKGLKGRAPTRHSANGAVLSGRSIRSA